MTNDWISFKEREPTEAELPVEVFRPRLPNELWIYRSSDGIDVEYNKTNKTLWRPHVPPGERRPHANGWIPFVERAPTRKDLPVLVTDYGTGSAITLNSLPIKNWDAWQPFHPPEPPKPKAILRHYDGREEEIEGPVYIFPETIETGDEWVVVTDIGEVQWVRCLKPSDENPKRVRRRIA